MQRALIIRACGPGTTVQDLGRFGYVAQGASPGGAADRDAMFEGAALLGQAAKTAGLEITGLGGRFEVSTPTRIALTGARAQARLDEQPLAWNASHLMQPGQGLSIGPPQGGNYSYLHLGGGIATPPFMGSRSTHLVARIGAAVTPGALPLGEDPGTETGLALPEAPRFGGGTLRIIASAQTNRFSAADLARLQNTEFTRDPRGNRMGARMSYAGAPFQPEGGLSILSEMVVPGDIQIAGDGAPFVLLGECQTTGGYPRIGTVIPPDLPRVAQARPGEALRFALIPRDAALAAHEAALRALAPQPRLRDPRDIPDLLSYQLIDGATAGDPL
jgi:allophanate hydrolase